MISSDIATPLAQPQLWDLDQSCQTCIVDVLLVNMFSTRGVAGRDGVINTKGQSSEPYTDISRSPLSHTDRIVIAQAILKKKKSPMPAVKESQHSLMDCVLSNARSIPVTPESTSTIPVGVKSRHIEHDSSGIRSHTLSNLTFQGYEKIEIMARQCVSEFEVEGGSCTLTI